MHIVKITYKDGNEKEIKAYSFNEVKELLEEYESYWIVTEINIKKV